MYDRPSSSLVRPFDRFMPRQPKEVLKNHERTNKKLVSHLPNRGYEPETDGDRGHKVFPLFQVMKRQTETPIIHFLVELEESNEIRSLVRRFI